MKVSQKDRIAALREMVNGDYDLLTVEYMTNASEAERLRQAAFKNLVDLGFAVELSRRSFGDGVGFPKDDRDRPITSEINYRVTAQGRRELSPWYEKAFANIAQNSATIVVSVVTALIIQWVLTLWGPD